MRREASARAKPRSSRVTLRILLLSILGATVAIVLSPVTVLNLLAPTSGVTREVNVRYGAGPRQQLDLYRPRNAKTAPIAVFMYGGSWQRGEKESYAFLANALARRGIVVAVPDYTLYPEAGFPRFLEDTAAAVAWASAWAKRESADAGAAPRQLVLMGHSAGAHIAAMLAYDARWLAPHGLDPRRDIAGFVGLAGPYDFLPIKDPLIQRVFQHPELETTQPITFVKGGEAPTFLGVSPSDTVVRPGNSERLARRLESGGARVVLQAYPRTNHLTLVGSFSPLLSFLAPVAADVAHFIHGLPNSKLAR